MAILLILGPFIGMVNEKNPDAANAISQGVIGTCNVVSQGPTAPESVLDQFNDIHAEITPAKCAAKWQCAIRVATNGTVTEAYNFTDLWIGPKSEIELHVQNILKYCPIAADIAE